MPHTITPAMIAVMHDILAAQLTMWDKIGELADLTQSPTNAEENFHELVMELAIEIDTPEDITDQVAENAVRWICFGQAQNATVESEVTPCGC